MKLLLTTVTLYCIAQLSLGCKYRYVADSIDVQQLAPKLKIKESVCIIGELRLLKVKHRQADALIEEAVQTFVDLFDGLNFCEKRLSNPPTESELVWYDLCIASYTARGWVAAVQLQRLAETEIENIQLIRDGISYALSTCIR